MAIDYLGYGFAAIVAAGGIFGFVKAGSVASLSAGLIFGALLAAGSFMNGRSPPKPLLQLVVTLILLIMMGYKFSQSGKFMPAGLIVVLSIIIFVRSIVVYRKYFPFVGSTTEEQ
ncbi:unnamed protein product [Diamesa tonsa]